MNIFTFGEYTFDQATLQAKFSYSYGDLNFIESIQFVDSGSRYNQEVLTRALDLAHLLIGISYYKAFPTREVAFSDGRIDQWQADFLNNVYQEGLSQFAFENDMTRDDLVHFVGDSASLKAIPFEGKGTIALQSGGKDSLLVAELLKEMNIDFTPLYISSSSHHPVVIDEIGHSLLAIERHIDKENLAKAQAMGGKNGHVPVTYIVLAISLVQAILSGKNKVLAAIGHEGEEPHAHIGDLPVTHQWSKTWEAEKLFAEYVHRYISPDIDVGSPLRQYSELKIAQLFVEKSWQQYGHLFSSCNRANYGQGNDNSQLTWCGDCPKCANSYLLFSPFVDAVQLKSIFGNKDLFTAPELQDTFKGLLGIDATMKPFECVGEVDELRCAYQLSRTRGGYGELSFVVPESSFDINTTYDYQELI